MKSNEIESAAASVAEPKPGDQTSSYKVVLLTIIFAMLAPLPPLVAAVLVQRGYLPDAVAPAVESYLTQALVAVAGAFGIGGVYAMSKSIPEYIAQRGEVSKIKALAAVGASTAETSPALTADTKGDRK